MTWSLRFIYFATHLTRLWIKERRTSCLKIGGELSGVNCPGGEFGPDTLISLGLHKTHFTEMDQVSTNKGDLLKLGVCLIHEGYGKPVLGPLNDYYFSDILYLQHSTLTLGLVSSYLYEQCTEAHENFIVNIWTFISNLWDKYPLPSVKCFLWSSQWSRNKIV